jgi:hypothetical protein
MIAVLLNSTLDNGFESRLISPFHFLFRDSDLASLLLIYGNYRDVHKCAPRRLSVRILAIATVLDRRCSCALLAQVTHYVLPSADHLSRFAILLPSSADGKSAQVISSRSAGSSFNNHLVSMGKITFHYCAPFLDPK